MEQTYNRDIPSLAQLPRETAKQAIAKQLILVKSAFSVTNDAINADALHLACELILEEYPNLKVNEIQLVVKGAIKGHYGENYNRIDVAVVLLWFRKYYEQREQLHATLRKRDHEQRKSEMAGPLDPEVQKRAIQVRDKIFAQWRKDADKHVRDKVALELEGQEEASRLRREYLRKQREKREAEERKAALATQGRLDEEYPIELIENDPTDGDREEA